MDAHALRILSELWCFVRLRTCTFFCEIGHEHASLRMCVALHLHVHRYAQQLSSRRAYIDSRRASLFSGAFLDSERTLSFVSLGMVAAVCVRVWVCGRCASVTLVCAPLHDISTQCFVQQPPLLSAASLLPSYFPSSPQPFPSHTSPQ